MGPVGIYAHVFHSPSVYGTRLRAIGSLVTHGHRHYPNVHEPRMDGTRYMYNRMGSDELQCGVNVLSLNVRTPIPVAQTTQGT